jgi:hypothetical protein
MTGRVTRGGRPRLAGSGASSGAPAAPPPRPSPGGGPRTRWSGQAGRHRNSAVPGSRGAAARGVAADSGGDRGLLVATQAPGPLGEIPIPPDDLADGLPEARVRRALEGRGPGGWEPEGLPKAAHGRRGPPPRAGHRARGPRGGLRRRLLQGLREDGLDRRIGEAAAGPRF